MRALELFREAESPFDLVISDVVMPSIGGQELLESIRKLEPDLPFLLTSGYPKTGDAADESARRVAFIQKPFADEELKERIAALLA